MIIRQRLAASIVAATALAAPGVQAQDANPGKAVFAQCASCHAIDASNGVGPSLQGVVGRRAGSFAGFRYSRAMKAAGTTWDATTLDGYIADPQKAVPGNVMPFAGISDAKPRADLVGYLKTLT